MNQSTRPRKPDKPSPDFPLFPHNNGLWAKKVRGKLWYFGPWNDPDAALQRWFQEKDNLLGGRVPDTRNHDDQTPDTRRGRRPKKPRPDFPLFAHASGRWAKKIRGKLQYFGPWDDHEGALNKYLEQKDDLHAGRKPRVLGDTLTVRDLLNRFLTSKKLLADSGEISLRTFVEYHACCERVGEAFGLERAVTDLAADDFEQLRARLTKTWGPVTLGNEIQRVRSLFRYAFDAALIDRPVRIGPVFRRPAKKVLRRLRRANGHRMFEAAELRALVAAAGPQMRAMVLLGINCGFGNADCGTLPQNALDLKRGWVDYPRPKTGAERRCPLWPETVDAIRASLSVRPAPKDAAGAGLVFVTRAGGRWFKGVHDSTAGQDIDKLLKAARRSYDNPISKEMTKLLKAMRRVVLKDARGAEHTLYLTAGAAATTKGKEVKAEDLAVGMTLTVKDAERALTGEVIRCELVTRRGVNFYAIRHTFETVGGDSKDQVAVDYIMGHAREDMASVYREKIGDDRLRAVVEHVRAWLFFGGAAASGLPKPVEGA
jgi:integrase